MLAEALESPNNHPLRALNVHINKISNIRDLRELFHDVYTPSLQTQSKKERSNLVTLSDTSGGPQELMPMWPAIWKGQEYAYRSNAPYKSDCCLIHTQCAISSCHTCIRLALQACKTGLQGYLSHCNMNRKKQVKCSVTE
jgi:hypothetical protein